MLPKHAATAEVVSASLLTGASGAELHLMASDGHILRLRADEPTAQALAVSLWRALDARSARPHG